MQTQTLLRPVALAGLTALAVAATPPAAHAAPEPGIEIFHVGVDKAENVGFGTYTGLPNPNFDRLTLMLSHTFTDNPTRNHFHRIGSFSYSGDAADPQPGFSGNNRIPEPYQGDDGLSLLPGAGAFDGLLVSGLGPAAFPGDEVEQEYGDVSIRPMDNLLSFDGRLADAGDARGQDFHPGHYLVNASGGAYKNPIDGTTVGLRLIDIDAGLTVHDRSGVQIFNSLGDVFEMGTSASWVFDPVFAVDGAAAAGSTFSATFELTDLLGHPELRRLRPLLGRLHRRSRARRRRRARRPRRAAAAAPLRLSTSPTPPREEGLHRRGP